MTPLDLELPGLTPAPLGSYLAALGLLRAVGTAFPEARGWWSEAGTFWLRSRMRADELVDWLVRVREPEMFVRPWNPDEKEDQALLDVLPTSWSRARNALEFSVQQMEESARLKALKKWLKDRKNKLKQEGDDAKQHPEVRHLTDQIARANQVIGAAVLRSLVPEEALSCFDCAAVTTADGKIVNGPLLGSGGNDGRRDFMRVYHRQLRATLEDGARSQKWLRAALGLPGGQSESLPEESGNSWFPDSIKIHNSGQEGFFTEQPASPWSYLLACEGIRLLVGCSSRRLGMNASPIAAFPFVFLPPAYASKETTRKTNFEFWAPLWEKPAKWTEVAFLLRSGRAAVSGRAAERPHQIAQALLARGVDRGIAAFQRFSLDHTTSKNTFEVIPLQRFRVRAGDGVAARCLAELETWYSRLPPDSARVVVGIRRRVEDAILHVCEAPQEARRWERLLVTCADAELRIARNKNYREKTCPLPPLSAEWLRFAARDVLDQEFVFAAAAASVAGLRENIFGAKRVWSGVDLLHDLAEIVRRRLLDSPVTEALALSGSYGCPLGVLAAFLDGRLDGKRIQALIPAFALLGWSPTWKPESFGLPRSDGGSPRSAGIPMPLVMMKCLFQPENFELAGRRAFGDRKFAPRCPEAFASLLRGDAERALAHIMRRLRASGLRPVALSADGVDSWQCRRWAAGLLVPWALTCLQQGLRDVLEVEDGRDRED